MANRLSPTDERIRRKFSLDVTRNFGILSALAFTITLGTQVLSRAGDDKLFQTLQAAFGSVLALALMLRALNYVWTQDDWNWNTSTFTLTSTKGMALFVMGVFLAWHVIYLSTFFSREQ